MEIELNENIVKRILILAAILILLIILSVRSSLKNKNKEPVNNVEYSEKERADSKKNTYDNDREKLKLLSQQLHDFKIVSPELKQIVKNRKISSNELGEFSSEVLGFSQISGKNIKIKRNYGSVLAIIFLKDYEFDVIQGIKPGISRQEVISKLGSANYSDEDKLLYMTSEFDLIINFTLEEIAVYLNKPVDESISINFEKQLWDNLDIYIEDNNLKKYISNITRINPEYFSYDYSTNGAILNYSDLGIKLEYIGENKSNGVYLYNNYYRNLNNTASEYLVNLQRNGMVINEEIPLSLELENKRNIDAKYILEKAENITLQLSKEKDSLLNIYKHKIPQNIYVYYEKSKERRYNYENIFILDSNIPDKIYKINQTGKADDILINGDYVFFAINYDGIYLSRKGYGEEKILDVKEKISLKSFENNILEYNDKTFQIQ